MIDAFFLFEVYLNFRTTYYIEETNELVTSKDTIGEREPHAHTPARAHARTRLCSRTKYAQQPRLLALVQPTGTCTAGLRSILSAPCRGI